MLTNIIDTKRYPQSLIFSINCLKRIEESGHKLNSYNLISLEEGNQLLNKSDYLKYLEEIKLSFTS